MDDVMKDPVTDPGKRSKAGRLKLVRENGTLKTALRESQGEDLLVTVFENGRVTRDWSLSEIRERTSI